MTRETSSGIEIDATPAAAMKEDSGTYINMGTGERRKASISELAPQPAPEGGNKKKGDALSYQGADILEGDDSPFAQYKREKIEQYKEDMAKFDEERQRRIDEGILKPEDIKDEDFKAQNGEKMVRDDDLLLDELEETEDQEEEIEEAGDEVDELQEAMADSEDSPENVGTGVVVNDDEDIEEDDDEAEVLADTASVEDSAEIKEEETKDVKDMKVEKKEEPPKKKYVDASGIDLEVKTEVEKVEVEEEEEEEEVDTGDQDELLDHLRKLATERIKPSATKLDISSFTVAKKATANVSSVISTKEYRVSKWVLPHQEHIVLMKEFSGIELQTLLENMEDAAVSSLTRRYRMIYDHIVSTKPESFEKWLKITPASDLDHYYFAVFIASYKGANYLPMDCPNKDCKEKSFISDDIPIMDMVKFDDDESKKKFNKIYKEETDYENKDGIYITERVPISDSIAIGFKEPTLFSFIEPQNIDDAFRRRYENLVNIIPYIDELYLIDNANHTLIPVDYNRFPNSPGKDIKSRIRKYSTIINMLTPDQFNLITAFINDFVPRLRGKMHYVEPEMACPYCGTTKPEADTTAENLVFTRYQLGALVTTSRK